MTERPHVPSSMCVDSCDNPYVCRDEYDQRVAECAEHGHEWRYWIPKNRFLLLCLHCGITRRLGDGAATNAAQRNALAR